MKEKEIDSNGNKIILSRDFLSYGFGIILIFVSLILSGLFSFLQLGGDFSILKSADYWITYFTNLGILFVGYVGSYLLRKTSNRNRKSLLVAKAELNVQYRDIIKNNQRQLIDMWLAEIYNYEQRILLWENIVTNKLQKPELEKPEEDIKIYRYKLKKYEKRKAYLQEWKNQLKNISIHKQIIEYLRKGDKELATKEKEKLVDDKFNNAKIKWKNIRFIHIFNGISTKNQTDSLFPKEGIILFNNIAPMLFTGIIWMLVICSVIGSGFQEVSLTTIVHLLFNIVLTVMYCFTAITVADKTYNDTLAVTKNRSDVVVRFLEDTKYLSKNNPEILNE